MNDVNERIARWAGHRPKWNAFGYPAYDGDIRFWHGRDGLLAKIEEEGLMDRFCYGDGDIGERPWLTEEGIDVAAVLTATPAQLAAALDEVIPHD